MSYSWAAVKTDKNSIIIGSIFWGIAITMIIGLPLLLLLRNYGYELPIWYGVIFVLVVYPLITYSLYRSGCKRQKKKN